MDTLFSSVRYKLREDPKLLQSISLSMPPQLVALSPDAAVVAVAQDTSITCYSCSSGVTLEEFDAVHTGWYWALLGAPRHFIFDIDEITAICWEPNGMCLASAGGEDKYIRLWHNTAGMAEQVKLMEEKLLTATSEPLKVCITYYCN